MTRNQIKQLVKAYLENPNATDAQIAAALEMTKGNFSKYVDPLNSGQIKTIKSWCFDRFDKVEELIPEEWKRLSV